MIALVTGSGSGIGQAATLRLARRGHTVYAAVRDIEAAADIERIARDEELNVHVVAIDVANEESVLCGVSRIFEREAGIDALVNCAGVGGVGAIEETDDDKLRHILDVNVLGPLRLIRAVLPAMRAQGGGAIVSVSSLLGRLVMPPLGLYSASKFALEAACEALAMETRGTGVRVAIIEPGIVITPMLRKHAIVTPPETAYAGQYRRAEAIFKRLAAMRTSPENVAAAIEHAITTDEPRLRYLVGKDAKTLSARRADMSDEEWLGPDRQLDDDEWFRLAEEALGIDFRPAPARRAA